MAENFLKSSPKYLLACASSGTHGKIRNWGYIWPKSVKKLPFFPKIQFFEGFGLITSILSLVLAENFLKSYPKYLLACASSGTRGKIQNWGFFGQKVTKNCHFSSKIQFFAGF